MKRNVLAIFVLQLLLATQVHADEVRSDLALGVYVSDVTDDAVAVAPQWPDSSREPPLSIASAVRAATAKLKTLPVSDEPVKWILHHVSLRRASNSGWYYIATFRSRFVPDPSDGRGRVTSGSNPYVTPRDLHIPVLMDGVVPKISVKRHSDELLKLLDDLGM